MIKYLYSDCQVTSAVNVQFSVGVVPPWDAASNDPSIQNVARRRRTIKGIRLLRRKINYVIHTERENAIIYRLLATRFPSDSNQTSSLRSLGQRAMRRVQRLKGPLAELGEIWSPAPRTWGFFVRRLRALYTPRHWLCYLGEAEKLRP
jgi:hypothetical protein